VGGSIEALSGAVGGALHRLAVVTRLGALERGLKSLSEELSAEPFKSDRNALLMRGRSGTVTLGYDDAGPNSRVKGGYADFEDIFRGSNERIRELLRPYLPILRDHQPIIELGCGRGEFLDLAADAGFRVTGVDNDPSMIERAAERGHRVVNADGIDFLRNLGHASVGSIFSAQVIEHLAIEQLRRLLEVSARVLDSGGVFVAETVNPHCVQAAKVFWLDVTHRQPIFPEALLFLCRNAGFRRAEIFFPTGSGNLIHDRRYESAYAVIASKP